MAAPAEYDYTTRIQRWSTAEVAVRALLAVAVLMLFYAFCIGVVALLAAVTWLQLQFFKNGGGVVLALVILPPLAALAIVLAIWPRFETWADPGRGLTEQRAPELFQVLRDVSRVTRQPMPRRLYLFNDVNAWVANRGMFMGRAMGIGLPLFDLLTVSELRAVVAHEYGHNASRAGGLSTFVYRTVRTFARTIGAAGIVPGLNIVFAIWAVVYLRIAMPISRQQELRADELGVRVAGVEATISALTKINKASPFGDLDDAPSDSDEELYRTHPPLRDRVALARTLNLEAELPADERPARVLLESLLTAQGALLSREAALANPRLSDLFHGHAVFEEASAIERQADRLHFLNRFGERLGLGGAVLAIPVRPLGADGHVRLDCLRRLWTGQQLHADRVGPPEAGVEAGGVPALERDAEGDTK